MITCLTLHLIRFRLAAIFWLQIQNLFHTLLSEYVVTSTDAFLKTQAPQQASHIVKGNVRGVNRDRAMLLA
jgi:hypothetical protein